MNVFDYVDEYGIYSFDEEPFNEVDSTIFSFLSYVDYGLIVERKKLRLSDVGRMHFGLHHKDKNNVIAVRDGTKLLNYIKDTKRYKDCILYNYVYEASHDIQFSVICIEYQNGYVYVSFEGTNQMISGWKENLILSYEFPTISHRKAIEYLNKNFTFVNKKIIVGGHSKGGNLALVAGMGCNFLVRRKIIKIYNFDGPGLLDKEFESRKFSRILNKYVHIIPDDSMVGIILNNKNDIVIKSNVNGPLAHDILYWEVNRNNLKNGKLSSFSKELKIGINNFVKSHTKDELMHTIKDLDMVCRRAKVASLIELRDSRKIISIINEAKKLNKSSRNILYEFIGVFIRAFGNSAYSDFKSFVSKFKLDT